MNDVYAIDLQGVDEPDYEELSEKVQERLDQIDNAIYDLINEYFALTGHFPHISGYIRKPN